MPNIYDSTQRFFLENALTTSRDLKLKITTDLKVVLLMSFNLSLVINDIDQCIRFSRYELII